MAGLLATISIAAAQNPLEAAAGSLQEQMNTAGQQLQEKAVQHALEGNLTQEHIAQDLDAGKENLTEQLQQKAAEELKKQVSEQIKKQPGFEAALAILATLAAAVLIRRRN
ncbi:MAG: PGF-CTERM sorting domain-containing protein [Methanothrix sp.]|nr:PGF-CTERM sorting domain-containing protein [Methanothrix sp.]